jgi:hypothetical protein
MAFTNNYEAKGIGPRAWTRDSDPGLEATVESSGILGMASKFVSISGEMLADLKRREIATIDADLLRLKREQMAEALEQLRADVGKAAEQKKAEIKQDFVHRGLANSTVLDSMIQRVEQDAAAELDKASREYSRNLEEIALMERKIAVQNKPSWRKLLNLVGIRRFG